MQSLGLVEGLAHSARRGPRVEVIRCSIMVRLTGWDQTCLVSVGSRGMQQYVLLSVRCTIILNVQPVSFLGPGSVLLRASRDPLLGLYFNMVV